MDHLHLKNVMSIYQTHDPKGGTTRWDLVSLTMNGCVINNYQTLTKDELVQHLLSKMEGNMQLLYTEGVRICSTMFATQIDQ